jgi:hypothetical protein
LWSLAYYNTLCVEKVCGCSLAGIYHEELVRSSALALSVIPMRIF